jgi:AraC-like DNA-binding protein
MRLHSGHFFHLCADRRLAVATPGQTHAATSPAVVFAPGGFLYQLIAPDADPDAPAPDVPILTLRVRTRAFSLAVDADREAWDILRALGRWVEAHGPVLAVDEPAREHALSLALSVVHECRDRRLGWQAQAKGLMFRFLNTLARDDRLGSQLSTDTDPAFARIREVLWHLDEHFTEDAAIDRLAELAGLSRSHFQMLFKRYTGQTVVQYATRRRIGHACQLLTETDQPILAIADRCGYGSLSRFYAAFNQITGATPDRYRRRQ